MQQTYIYDAIRSARTRAKPDGGLHELTPQELLRQLYNEIRSRTTLDATTIEEVILGCATQAGEQAGNIAKTSLLYSGWPDHIPGLTINRYCASSLEAVNLASAKIGIGQLNALIAGGVEMMSRIPMLADSPSVFTDPEFSRDCRMLMMGSGADLIASQFKVSREQADEIAFQSQQRASIAQQQGRFKSIVEIDNPIKQTKVSADECIRPATTLERLASLTPAFAELGASGIDNFQLDANPALSKIDHIHTAGNSPAMADAAAVVLLANAELESKTGLKPRAKILSIAIVCDDPLRVVSGCVTATEKLLHDNQIKADQIDLFEVHEAFAATMVMFQKRLAVENERLNVNGGVIALGHPMGATGAIMLGTLLDELERRNLKTGIVAMSGAAGTGTAMLIERI